MADMQLGLVGKFTEAKDIPFERVGLAVIASLDHHAEVRCHPDDVGAWVGAMYRSEEHPANVVVLAETHDLLPEQERSLWLAITNAGGIFDSLSRYNNDIEAAIQVWRDRFDRIVERRVPLPISPVSSAFGPAINWDLYEPFACNDEELLEVQAEMAKSSDFTVVT